MFRQFARVRRGWAAHVGVAVCLAVCPGIVSNARADQRSECLASHVEAQILRKRGALLEARDKLLICAQEGCPAPIANDCATWVGEIDASLSSVVFAVSDTAGQDVIDARIFANGKLIAERADGRAVSLDPGKYTFRFEAPPRAAVEETVSIRQSEKNRIVRVQFEPMPAPAPATTPARDAAAQTAKPGHRIPLGTWVLGGVAVASGAAFATFALLGHGKYEDAKDCRANSRCTELDSLIDAGKRNYVVADIALGVAIASAGAAIIVFLVDSGPRKPSRAESAIHVEPDFVHRGLNIRGSF
jgi:hypothetical protein